MHTIPVLFNPQDPPPSFTHTHRSSLSVRTQTHRSSLGISSSKAPLLLLHVYSALFAQSKPWEKSHHSRFMTVLLLLLLLVLLLYVCNKTATLNDDDDNLSETVLGEDAPSSKLQAPTTTMR